MNASERSLQEKMQALKVNYLKGLRERKEKLNHLLILVEQNALSAEDRTELKSQAHKLAGTGTTYGFPKISEAGRALEDWLIDNPENDGDLLKLTRSLLAVCSDALQSEPKPVGTFGRKTAPAPIKDTPALPLLLIVDDDENIRNILTGLFSDDAHIITGVNTTEALELMTKHKPDLVLLDDMMPGGVSGLRMLEDIRSIPDIKNIPIIMITARDKPEEVMRGLMAGAADYITKPFVPENIAVKVRGRLKRLHSQILIADDDEAVREILEHKFQTAGCNVVCAADGAEARAMLLKQPFSLVVLDRMMPGYDGMTLLRMMREDNALSAIPVVFLTARHYGADVLEGLNTSAADYITKPFNPDEVVTRCLRLIAGKET